MASLPTVLVIPTDEQDRASESSPLIRAVGLTERHYE